MTQTQNLQDIAMLTSRCMHDTTINILQSGYYINQINVNNILNDTNSKVANVHGTQHLAFSKVDIFYIYTIPGL